jgi:hypothetical protein
LSSGSNFYANPNMDTGIMNDLTNLSGYQGSLLGANIYVTTAVATANTGADRAGAAFVTDALGRYEVWGPRVEAQRNAFLPGDRARLDRPLRCHRDQGRLGHLDHHRRLKG